MSGEGRSLANIEGLEETDLSLMSLIAQRDEQAMARLFDRHSRLVYSVALRVVRSRDRAEDVLQEVFTQLWQTPVKSTEGTRSLGPLLAVMSRNRSIDLIRAGKRADFVKDIPLASSVDLTKIYERHLVLERAHALVAELPDDQRDILELAFFEGMTHNEIAKATGFPLGTIKTRIRSALQKLGEAFRHEGERTVRGR